MRLSRRSRSSYGVLHNFRNKFCNTALDTLHLLGVLPQGCTPELDPILEVRPYQGLEEGKYDITGFICNILGNHLQNITSLFATLIDLVIPSQITRD